jgi:hypothetical protein
MKRKRLLTLQASMATVLLVYLLFASFLFFSLPSYATPIRLSKAIAEKEVRTDDLPKLQSDFRLAISYVGELQRDRIELLLASFVASVAVVGFLGWSIFVVSRVKREVDHVA